MQFRLSTYGAPLNFPGWISAGEGMRVTLIASTACYCSFAYSALASFRVGMSGSASFQRLRKS